MKRMCRAVLQIYEIPFFVALDHKKESILVAVRGTLSLKVSSVAWPVSVELFVKTLLFLVFTSFIIIFLLKFLCAGCVD